MFYQYSQNLHQTKYFVPKIDENSDNFLDKLFDGSIVHK